MQLTKLISLAVGIVVIYYAVRTAITVSSDWARTDRMHDMSGEPSFATEIPGLTGKIFQQEGAAVSEWGRFFTHFSNEMARYLKAKAM